MRPNSKFLKAGNC